MKKECQYLFESRESIITSILMDFFRAFNSDVDLEIKNNVDQVISCYEKLDLILNLKEVSLEPFRSKNIREKEYNGIPSYEFAFKKISEIKDLNTREHLFEQTYSFLKSIDFGPTTQNIKETLKLLYESNKNSEMIFLKKKFPEMKISKNKVFLEIVNKAIEDLSPENKIKQIEHLLRYHNIKKINPINNYKGEKYSIIQAIMHTDKITKSYPTMIIKLLAMGDVLDDEFIETLNTNIKLHLDACPYKKILPKTLDQMKDILLKHFDFEKINSNNTLVSLSEILRYSKEDEQEKTLKDIKNTIIRATLTLHLILKDKIGRICLKKECCNEYTLKKEPLYFTVLRRFSSNSKISISFLENNDIDYTLKDKHGDGLLESVFYGELSKEERRIINYIESHQLNSTTENEFNL